MVLLYHERQVAALCGVHCLNTLLQGPWFSEVELAQIANDLDAKEKALLGGNVEGWEHANSAMDGMFSVQVLSEALQQFGLRIVGLHHPDLRETAAKHPEKEAAFLVNLREHWFTIRRVEDGTFWDFNSLHPAPKKLSNFYVAAYLSTLEQQGWQIFVVQGTLPDVQYNGPGPGRWVRDVDAEAETKSAEGARQQGYLKAALEGALARADKGQVLSSAVSASKDTEEDDLAAAIAASLEEDSGADADLKAAIAASLRDAEGHGEAGPSGVGAFAGDSPDRDAPAEASGGLATAPSLDRERAWNAQPPEGAPCVALVFRLPGSRRIQHRFPPGATVGDVARFLAMESGLDMRSLQLVRAYPRQVVRLSDAMLTLADAGIQDKDSLIVEEIK